LAQARGADGRFIGEASIRVTADGSGFADSVRSTAGAGLSRLGGILSDAITTPLKIGAAVAGTAIGVTLGTAISTGLARLSAIDNAKGKLQGLGYTGEQVAGVMENALAAVKGTAFGLGDAATIAASMMAAGIPAGQELESTLKSVGDAATIGGTSLTDMGAIFGKVAATGKLQGDELMQLSERGIPALSFLAKHFGTTNEEAQKMVREGKVSFADFKAAMDENIGGAALASGNTFAGGLANVKAALGRVGAAAMEPGFQALKTIFQQAIPAIDNLGKALQPIFDSLNAKIIPAVSAAATAFFGFLSNVDFSGLTGGLSSVAGIIAPLTGLFAGLLGPLLGEIPLVGKLFAGLTGPVGLVIGLLIEMFRNSEQLRDAFGTLFSALGSAFSSLGPAIETISGALSTLMGGLGDALAQVLTAVVPLIGIFAQGIAALAPLLPPIAALLAQVAGIIGQVLSAALTAIMPLFQMLVTTILPALMPIVTQIIAFVGQLAAQIGGILVQAVSMIIPLFVQLASMVLPILVQILQSLMPILEALGPLITTVFGILSSVISAVIPVIQALLPVVQTVFEAIASIISAAVDVIVDVIHIVTAILSGDWSAAWEAAQALVGHVWDLIKSIVEGAVNIVKSVITGALNAISSIWNSIWNTIGSTVTGVWNTITSAISSGISNAQSFISNGLNSIRSTWDSIWNSVTSSIAGVWNGIVSAVQSGISNVTGAISGIKNTITGFFSGAGSWLVSAGSSIISGFVSGIKSAIGAVTSAVGDVMSAARNLLPFSPAKEGPFSGKGWTLYSGKAIVNDLSKGIAAQEDELVRTVNGVMGAAADAATMGGSLTVPVSGGGGAGSGAMAGSGIANYEINVTVPMDDLAQLKTFEDFMSMLRVRTRMGVTVGG
jgi:tape measure domain-containing protein